MIGKTRVVFYCHFPDKLLANGAFVHGQMKMRGSLLKRLYRMPMDWLEELTTRTFDNLYHARFDLNTCSRTIRRDSRQLQLYS